MNVDGLSEATLEKFVDEGFIKNYSDIYSLDKYKDAIIGMEGFGEKSYENLMDSINASKDVHLANLVYALGIPNIGLANAKLICKAFDYDTSHIFKLTKEELSLVDQIGDVIADSVASYFADIDNQQEILKLLSIVNLLPEETIDLDSALNGKTVVVTGSLNHYDSRKDLQNEIELRGGKVSGSVSKNTFLLVNNDINSNSSKNKTAKSLGIEIITEDDFIQRFLQ